MIYKSLVPRERGSVVRVTFTLPSFLWADAIYLVGEFNDWSVGSHPLRQDRTGTWRLSLDLEPNHTYLFGYLCDGEWLAEHHADGFVRDAEGKMISRLVTDEARALPHTSSMMAPQLAGDR